MKRKKTVSQALHGVSRWDRILTPSCVAFARLSNSNRRGALNLLVRLPTLGPLLPRILPCITLSSNRPTAFVRFEHRPLSPRTKKGRRGIFTPSFRSFPLPILASSSSTSTAPSRLISTASTRVGALAHHFPQTMASETVTASSSTNKLEAFGPYGPFGPVFQIIPGVQNYDWGITGKNNSLVGIYGEATEQLKMKVEPEKPYAEVSRLVRNACSRDYLT